MQEEDKFQETKQIFANEKISDIEQIQDRGLVNNIYIVTTEKEKYILRIDPEETNLERFNKEKWCTEISLKNGILSPEIYKIGLNNRGNPYMIMEYIEGEDGDNSTGSLSKIWHTLGKYAQKLHNIPVTGFGGEMIKPNTFKDSWSNFLNYNISQLTPEDKLISLEVLTLVESKNIRTIFEELKNKNLQTGLSHYDLAPKNTRIDKEGNVYLIDWGSAGALPVPYFDIAEILDESLKDTSDFFKDFLSGYGLSYKKYLGIKPLINQLNLLMHIDKLRWALDKREDRVEYYTKKVKEKIALI